VAFKLFIYICLNARRDSGVMRTTQTELARNLRKTHGTIRKALREMESAGVLCQNSFKRSPAEQGTVQIASGYWPYVAAEQETVSEDPADVFVSEIRKALAQRACVRSFFSTADEVLARQWFSRNIPVALVKQAILMGCARKYVSWRNNQAHAPIAGLRYFDPILDEITQQKINQDYWGYIEFRMRRHEQLWIESHSQGDGSETVNNSNLVKV
jgi:hypothetical protein